MKVVVCIDVQNDFINGVLGVDKNLSVTHGIARYLENRAKEGSIIMATRDTHQAETYGSSLEGVKLPIPHCIMFSEGWKIPNEVSKYVPEQNICNKGTFGSFTLLDKLERIGLTKNDEIELVGFCTSICVISNAIMLRAKFPNVKISIVENLCGDVDDASHEAAIRVAKSCQLEVIGYSQESTEK